jgi:hypothetical protein
MRLVMHIVDGDDTIAGGLVQVPGPSAGVSGVPCPDFRGEIASPRVIGRLNSTFMGEMPGPGIVIQYLPQALGRQARSDLSLRHLGGYFLLVHVTSVPAFRGSGSEHGPVAAGLALGYAPLFRSLRSTGSGPDRWIAVLLGGGRRSVVLAKPP